MSERLVSCVLFRSTPRARRWCAAVALMPICLAATPPAARADAGADLPAVASAVRQGHPAAGLPMSFEANQGQFDDAVKFRSRGAGYSVVLGSNEAVLLLGDPQARNRPENLRHRRMAAKRGRHPEPPVQPGISAVVHLSLVDADANAEILGEAKSPGIANYFFGNDPARWHTAVPVFEKVRYRQVYSGIDLVYYGNQRQL